MRIFHVPLSLWGVSEYVAEAISRYGSIEPAYDLVIARLEDNRNKRGESKNEQSKSSSIAFSVKCSICLVVVYDFVKPNINCDRPIRIQYSD